MFFDSWKLFSHRKTIARSTLATVFTYLLLPPIAEATLIEQAKLPNQYAFQCAACHISVAPQAPILNPFGNDFKKKGRKWSPALAALDSDGDGYTNGVELQDPSGSWVPGQPDPGNVYYMSNPGLAIHTPLPTPTPFQFPTTPPTATPIPQSTPTSTTRPAPTATPTQSPTATPSPLPENLMGSFAGHQGEVTSLGFASNGRVITGSTDKTIRIWNALTGATERILTGHKKEVLALAVSPDGTRLLTGSADNTAKVWDLSTGKVLKTLSKHRGAVNAVAYLSDGNRVVTGSSDDNVILWDAAKGKVLQTFTGTQDILAVAVSPDDRFVMAGSVNGEATVWNMESTEVVHTITGHEGLITSVAFSPNGQYLLTAGADGIAQLWNALTGEPMQAYRGHIAQINAVDFSTDGLRLATGSDDGTVVIWSTLTAKILETFSGTDPIRSVAFSSDGNSLLSGGLDRVARLWDVSNIQPAPTATPTSTATRTPTLIPTSTVTLTPTITPTSEATPEPTPVIEPVVQARVYNFNGADAGANGFLMVTPGSPGEYNPATLSFGALDAAAFGDSAFTDGVGMKITMGPRQGATFYGNPITAGNNFVFLRISLRASHTTVSAVVGGLDAVPADGLAGANLDGSLGMNLMTDSTLYLNHFGSFEAFYHPKRSAVVPMFQAVNNGTETVNVQVDNFEIYLIPKTRFSVPSIGALSKGFFQVGDKIWGN